MISFFLWMVEGRKRKNEKCNDTNCCVCIELSSGQVVEVWSHQATVERSSHCGAVEPPLIC